MTHWICRLDEPSIERFRRELALPGVNNHVDVPGEPDLPETHVRQLAVDAFMVLARQQNPALERERIRTLMDALTVVCEPADTDAPGGQVQSAADGDDTRGRDE